MFLLFPREARWCGELIRGQTFSFKSPVAIARAFGQRGNKKEGFANGKGKNVLPLEEMAEVYGGD